MGNRKGKRGHGFELSHAGSLKRDAVNRQKMQGGQFPGNGDCKTKGCTKNGGVNSQRSGMVGGTGKSRLATKGKRKGV